MASQKVEHIEPGLSIQEDIGYQEKGWKFQQTAAYVILGMVVLIALGLFGDGLLSSATAEKEGVVVRYEKFLHHKGNTQLDISTAGVDSETVVSLPLSYLDHFAIETIVPEPTSNRVEGQAIIYTFTTRQTSRVSFFVSPLQWGKFTGNIQVNGTVLKLSYFTYP